MKIITKIAVLLSFFGFSATLLAAPYVSVQAGVYGINDKFFGAGRIAGGNLWNSNQAFKYGAELGFNGYQVAKNVYPRYYFADVNHERWSVDALGVVDIYPLHKLDVFFKAGAAYVNEDISTYYRGYRYSSSRDAIVPKVAVGFGYDISKNVNVNLAWSKEFQNNSHQLMASKTVMAGIKFNFC